MEKVGRRSFCGTAALALPLLCLQRKFGEDLPGQSDAMMDALADEIAEITTEGAQNGFKGEHLRRYAGVVRTFDAYMEQAGVNRNLNDRLDDDDFQRMNPAQAARMTAQYWQKRGISFDEEELAAQMAIAPGHYQEIKKAIKKGGGIRMLHKAAAEALERKSREYDANAIKNGPNFKKDPVRFPLRARIPRANFVQVQDIFGGAFPLSSLFTTNLDCLCKAMLVEGSILAIMCATGLLPCCEAAAVLLAIRNLLEAFGLCNSNNC